MSSDDIAQKAQDYIVKWASWRRPSPNRNRRRRYVKTSSKDEASRQYLGSDIPLVG